jgi:electron transport complex protein RnfD
MDKLVVVSPSPHNFSKYSVKKLMYGVIIALIPALGVSIYYFGIGAIVVTLTSIASALLCEYLITKFLLKKPPTLTDGSAFITGILLAFNVPSNLPPEDVAPKACAQSSMTTTPFSLHPLAKALMSMLFPYK